MISYVFFHAKIVGAGALLGSMEAVSHVEALTRL